MTMTTTGTTLDLLLAGRQRHEARQRVAQEQRERVARRRTLKERQALETQFIRDFGAQTYGDLNLEAKGCGVSDAVLLETTLAGTTVALLYDPHFSAWQLVADRPSTPRETLYTGPYQTVDEASDALLAKLHALATGDLDELPF